MTKLEVFDTVVTIMTEDAATKKDKRGADPESYRRRISEEMAEENFLYLMQSYMASFGVISHVSFRKKATSDVGFRLRKTEEALYVVEAEKETGLQKGDQILALDGEDLADVYRQHKDFFVSRTPERQREWAYFVKRAGQLRLRRGEEERDVTLSQASFPQKASQFEGRYVRPDTYYLKLEDFTDEAQIGQLYQESLPLLETVNYLIIDVRINYGGTDSLYFPLLPYLLPEGTGLEDLESEPDEGMEILYTPTNVAHRLALFEQFTANPDLSAETRQMIEEMAADLVANQEKGYVRYGQEEEEGTDAFAAYKGLAQSPKAVYILTDVTCGSSGDSFVSLMKQLPKVTVVGRPTLGILDYSNCCIVDFGDYELVYPTSRALALDNGKGMTDKGVEPDVWIPWTAEHLTRDRDLETVLDLIATRE